MAGLDILILAAVAAFILYRFYLVLGTRNGNERRPEERLPDHRENMRPQAGLNGRTEEAREDNVIPMPRPRDAAVRTSAAASVVHPGSEAAQGLAQIEAADSNFSAGEFVEGAKAAHEMIVQAFATGDRLTLKPLLADDVYRSFDMAITGRQRAQQTTEFSFVGLKSVEVAHAALQGRIAEITLRFVSELISATRDASGAVVDGVAGVVREVTDVWTFARDTRSSDPNWKLVATAA